MCPQATDTNQDPERPEKGSGNKKNHEFIKNIFSILAILTSSIALGCSFYFYSYNKKYLTQIAIYNLHKDIPDLGRLAIDHVTTLSEVQLAQLAHKKPYKIETEAQQNTLQLFLSDGEEGYLSSLPAEVKQDHSKKVASDVFDFLNAFELVLQLDHQNLADFSMLRNEFEVTLEQIPNLKYTIQRLRIARGNEASNAWVCIDKFLEKCER